MSNPSGNSATDEPSSSGSDGESPRRSDRRSATLLWLGAAGLTVVAIAAAIWQSASVQDYFVRTKALALLNAGQLQPAYQVLSDSGRVGEDARLTLLMVRTLRQLDRLQDSLTTLDDNRLLIGDSDRLRQETLLNYARAGQIQEAEPQLPDMLSSTELDERDVCEAFVIGYRLNYRFPEAHRLLDAWEQDAPDDYRVEFHRGVIFQMLTEWDDASAAFQTAIARGDRRATTQVRLGQCLLELNDADGARSAFQTATKNDPELLSAWLGLAQCCHELGLSDESRAAYEACLKLDSNHFEAKLALAEADAADGNPAAARQKLEELLRDWPEDAHTLYAYGQVLVQLGESDQAEEVAVRWKAADEAIVKMESLLNELKPNPQDAGLRSQIGVLMMKHYSRSMGWQYLESVLQTSPDDRAANEMLAEYYEHRGEPDRANLLRSRIAP
ncbi:MAG: tetratricopeptide repeat protein [Planctomycetaceae bacterium]